MKASLTKLYFVFKLNYKTFCLTFYESIFNKIVFSFDKFLLKLLLLVLIIFHYYH